MAPTTRKKNRISYVELDEDDFDWEDEEDVLVVAESSADVDNAKPPVKKKQKLAKVKVVKPPFGMLPQEVMTHMMLFLDSAKDIYSLSMVGSKHIRGAITTEVVVRSAVFSGGKQQRRMKELVQGGIQEKAVYLPDTFRLLRLLNGRQCERLELCYNYNLETKIPSKMILDDKSSLNQAHDLSFGMLICKTCAKGMSTKCGDGYGFYCRSVNSFWEVDKLICGPQTERVTGQPVGPLLHAHRYHQLSATYGHRSKKLDQAVDTIIADIPGYQEQYDNIVSSYKAANDHYPRFIQSQREIEIEKKRIKDQERAQRKLENQRKLLDRVELALSECDYKDKVLFHYVEESNIKLFGPADTALKGLLDAPSTASASRIQAAADLIKPIYDALGDYGFLTGQEYMNHPQSFPREEYQTVLYDYALENLHPLEVLEDCCVMRCEDCQELLEDCCCTWCQDCHELLEDCRCMWHHTSPRFRGPIVILLQDATTSARDRCLEFLMCFLSSSDIEKAYEAYLRKQGVQEESIEYALAYHWLCQKTWLSSVDYPADYRVREFASFWDGHVLIQKNYVEYQSYPAFVDWKAKLGEDAVLWSMFDDVSIMMLKDGNFEGLLRYQKSKSQDD